MLQVPIRVPLSEHQQQAGGKASAYQAHHAQEVTCVLGYKKHSGERFEVRSALDLHFRQPFHLDLSLLPLDSAPAEADAPAATASARLFARFLVHNATAATVTLVGYELSLPREWRVVRDCNARARGTALRADDSLCLLFEVEHSAASHASAASCTLQLHYAFSAAPAALSAPLMFAWPLRLAVPRRDYTLSVTHPPHTYKGAHVVLAWELLLAPHIALPHTLLYTLHVDERVWLPACKTRAHVRWQAGGERVAHVQARFVALKAGPLPLPTLRLEARPA